MFNWDELRFFLAVHRHGTLAGAGASLQLDPTTVGRRLNGLEARLETRLFDRTPRGYVLTASGLRLLPRAERIEREALAVERDVAGEDQKLEGSVKLTATEMLSTRFIAPHLAKFRDRFPEIELVLVCTRRDVDLARREADIALRLARPRQPDVIVRKLFSIELGLYASPEYIERFGLPNAKDGFAGHRFVLFADVPPFRQENEWFDSQLGPHTQVSVRSDSVSSVFSAAVAGTGVAMLPRAVAEREPGLVRVETTTAPEPRIVWQAVHPDLQHTARIRAVLDFLGEIFAPPKRVLRPVDEQVASA